MIRLLKILALFLAVLLFLSFMQNYVFAYIDQNSERVHSFYLEEKNSLDVVFMGASDVNTAFAPGLAYEKFGFTSYLYAFDANPGSLYKYQLKEILSKQNPQVIVIEINGIGVAHRRSCALLRPDRYRVCCSNSWNCVSTYGWAARNYLPRNG